MFVSTAKIAFLFSFFFAGAFALPVNISSPAPIGGCVSTRFGCCADNATSCINISCFNCPNKTRIVPTLIGGCSSTQFGCCDDKIQSCVDTYCSNCPNITTPTGSTEINKTISNLTTNLFGGCVSTRFGCCRDNVTACRDRPCSNCHVAFE
jgi:hypothetical protein